MSLAVLVPVIVIGAGFVVLCLVDLTRARQVRYLPKWVWALVCLISVPLAAVQAAAPEVIVHEMTALSGMRSFRNPEKLFATTNELRTRGTDNLLAAAAEAGTRRVIAQSYAGAGPDERPGPVKTEDDPLKWRPIRSATQGPAAIAHVEKTVPARHLAGLFRRGRVPSSVTSDQCLIWPGCPARLIRAERQRTYE